MTETRKKILICEDDADTRRGLNVRLRKEGYDTAFAGDAATALSVARKEQPDLVLLDLGLPAGDGYLVLDRMKHLATLGTTPVIVLSARDPEANRPRALQAGARAYLHKPVDFPELLQAIQTELGPSS